MPVQRAATLQPPRATHAPSSSPGLSLRTLGDAGNQAWPVT